MGKYYGRIHAGRALFMEADRIWIANGMNFYSIDYNGKRISRVYRVGPLYERVLSKSRILRQALRIGIHHFLPLSNGNYLVMIKKSALVVTPEGKIISAFTGFRGNKPAHQGICVADNGMVFFAEYLLNNERNNVIRLYRSKDNAITFNCVKEFECGSIRHIHFVKWDSFNNCLWLGTGDRDEENLLMTSYDYGITWSTIGKGSQDWRAIGLCFREKEVLWGTDAGSVPDINHLVRLIRENGNKEIIDNLEGPCHGCATLKDGRVFFSTGVEGAQNEKDHYARLKEYRDNKTITCFKLAKDFLPYIIQFGVIRFPLGSENSDKLVFTAMGLRHGGECVYVEQ